MSNTKPRKSRPKLNTATLAIRIPEQVLQQLDSICLAQFRNPSEVVRMLILDFIKTSQPFMQTNTTIPTVGNTNPRQHLAPYQNRITLQEQQQIADDWA